MFEVLFPLPFLILGLLMTFKRERFVESRMNAPWILSRPMRCAALFVSMAAASCRASESKLVFSLVDERVVVSAPARVAEPEKGGNEAPKSRGEREEGKLTVILGDSYFEEEKSDGSTLFDFRSNRVLTRQSG